MGAWGIDPFENDAVLDWWDELKPADLGALLDDLDRETGGLQASVTWEWQMLIAAADIVATALGAPDDGLPDDVVAWLAADRGQIGTDRVMALRSAVLASLDGELADAWTETETRTRWETRTRHLAERLAKAAGRETS